MPSKKEAHNKSFGEDYRTEKKPQKQSIAGGLNEVRKSEPKTSSKKGRK